MPHPAPESPQPDPSGRVPGGSGGAPAHDALLDRLAETAPVGIILSDATGHAVYVNPRMTAIAGREAAFLLGRDWSMMVHPDDRPRVVAGWKAFLASEDDRLRMDCRLVLPDGGERRVALETSRAVGADGGTTGYTSIVQDVSERHALEMRAREAQKMEAVGRLAGGVAHDFNNLLTVIRTYTEFLVADLPDGDPRRADAHQVLAATERAAALTRQLLAFGRRQPAATRPIDLNGAVRNLAPVISRVVGPEVRVALVLEAAQSQVKIDPGQLEQVLLNVTQNAREAMPEGGTLTIATATTTLTRQDVARQAMESTVPVSNVDPGEYVVLALRDAGRGMDRTTQGRMFEPFFTTKAPGAGVGLGLATVWGIVTQAGGHLRVASTPGAGTTIEILLPLVERLQTPRRPMGAISTPLPTPVPGFSRGETILVVEDEPAVRTSVRRILERVGYKVIEARHGLDARLTWEARRNEIALVLTDVVMPEIDGAELASALRALSPDVRFVFMSGYSDDQAGLTRRLGPRDVLLEKPFEARTLLERVRQAIDG